eukprot:353282-Chlamydomonas_euryale.AAC.2
MRGGGEDMSQEGALGWAERRCARGAYPASVEQGVNRVDCARAHAWGSAVACRRERYTQTHGERVSCKVDINFRGAMLWGLPLFAPCRETHAAGCPRHPGDQHGDHAWSLPRPPLPAPMPSPRAAPPRAALRARPCARRVTPWLSSGCRRAWGSPAFALCSPVSAARFFTGCRTRFFMSAARQRVSCHRDASPPPPTTWTNGAAAKRSAVASPCGSPCNPSPAGSSLLPGGTVFCQRRGAVCPRPAQQESPAWPHESQPRRSARAQRRTSIRVRAGHTHAGARRRSTDALCVCGPACGPRCSLRSSSCPPCQADRERRVRQRAVGIRATSAGNGGGGGAATYCRCGGAGGATICEALQGVSRGAAA